jgi:membrane-associated phospholipid phosphatase
MQSLRRLVAAMLVAHALVPRLALFAQVANAPVRAVDKTFFTKRDALVAAGAIAASAAISVFDERIARWTQQPSVQGDSSRYDAVHSMTFLNETPLTIAAAATWGIGRLAGSRTITDIGLHTTEALVLTVAVSEVIRAPLGRARPRASPDDAYRVKLGKGFTDFAYRSYPSLHAAAGFAAAAAVVGELRARDLNAQWILGPVLYGAAMVPGLTRMYLNQHWASDVLSGAMLGQLLGSKVVRYAHSHRKSRLDRVLSGFSAAPTSEGPTVILVVRY